MVCLGFEPGAAGWKARTNPLSYGGTPGPFFWKEIALRSFTKKLAIPKQLRSLSTNTLAYFYLIVPKLLAFSKLNHISKNVLAYLSLQAEFKRSSLYNISSIFKCSTYLAYPNIVAYSFIKQARLSKPCSLFFHQTT